MITILGIETGCTIQTHISMALRVQTLFLVLLSFWENSPNFGNSNSQALIYIAFHESKLTNYQATPKLKRVFSVIHHTA